MLGLEELATRLLPVVNYPSSWAVSGPALFELDNEGLAAATHGAHPV